MPRAWATEACLRGAWATMSNARQTAALHLVPYERLVSFMKQNIAQKDNLLRTKFEFMTVIGLKMWPTSTPKKTFKSYSQVCFREKTLKWSFAQVEF
jgi:hypothetical protein